MAAKDRRARLHRAFAHVAGVDPPPGMAHVLGYYVFVPCRDQIAGDGNESIESLALMPSGARVAGVNAAYFWTQNPQTLEWSFLGLTNAGYVVGQSDPSQWHGQMGQGRLVDRASQGQPGSADIFLQNGRFVYVNAPASGGSQFGQLWPVYISLSESTNPINQPQATPAIVNNPGGSSSAARPPPPHAPAGRTPRAGDTQTHGGRVWRYDGHQWVAQGGGQTASGQPPPPPGTPVTGPRIGDRRHGGRQVLTAQGWQDTNAGGSTAPITTGGGRGRALANLSPRERAALHRAENGNQGGELSHSDAMLLAGLLASGGASTQIGGGYGGQPSINNGLGLGSLLAPASSSLTTSSGVPLDLSASDLVELGALAGQATAGTTADASGGGSGMSDADLQSLMDEMGAGDGSGDDADYAGM